MVLPTPTSRELSVPEVEIEKERVLHQLKDLIQKIDNLKDADLQKIQDAQALRKQLQHAVAALDEPRSDVAAKLQVFRNGARLAHLIWMLLDALI